MAVANKMTAPRVSYGFSPTIVLISLNLIMYVYTSILSGSFIEMNSLVLRRFGQDNAYVLNGAWWQLFTAMFVHVDITHLASNMLFLFIFGLRADRIFSSTEYYAIYLLSGLAGNLLTLVQGPYAMVGYYVVPIVSAGASGAIFGVFGAITIYTRRITKTSIISALIFAALFFFLTSFSPGVNLLAHLGGLVTGLMLGYWVASSRRPSSYRMVAADTFLTG